MKRVTFGVMLVVLQLTVSLTAQAVPGARGFKLATVAAVVVGLAGTAAVVDPHKVQQRVFGKPAPCAAYVNLPYSHPHEFVPASNELAWAVEGQLAAQVKLGLGGSPEAILKSYERDPAVVHPIKFGGDAEMHNGPFVNLIAKVVVGASCAPVVILPQLGNRAAYGLLVLRDGPYADAVVENRGARRIDVPGGAYGPDGRSIRNAR